MTGQTTVEPSLAEKVLKELEGIGCDITINGNSIVKPEDLVIRKYAAAYAIEPAKDDSLLYWTLTPKTPLRFVAFPDFVQIIPQSANTPQNTGMGYVIHPRSSKSELAHRKIDELVASVREIYKPDAQS